MEKLLSYIEPLLSYIAPTLKPEVAFSGWGATLIVPIAFLFRKQIASIFQAIFSKTLKNQSGPNSETPTQTKDLPQANKNPLKIPKLSINQTGLNLSGGLKPIKNYDFKITNSGGKAFNIELTIEYLNAIYDVKDINRQGSKNFTAKFGAFDLPQTLNFKLKYLDEDGDIYTKYLNMKLLNQDYSPE